MSTTTDFIAELVRAANEVDLLTGREKRRLLERSVTAIRDMREAIGIRRSGTGDDAVIDIQTVEVLLTQGQATDEQVKAALLDAAGMIRDLHIVLDTGTEIQIGGGR
ncbi:MAG: hypothetical protein ACK4QP_04120 [Pseudorhizobium sp.]